jgi:selenocysteine lyase/cysteine desulfurase
MVDRRSFVASLTGAAMALPPFRADAIAQVLRAGEIAGHRRPEDVADDEEYWSHIQRAFDADRTLVNLNNGGVCPTPTHVLEAMIRDLEFSNAVPVENMWRVLEPRVEYVRQELALDFGCDPEEMAITRNASEAMEIMIFGLDLEPGDEVIVTNQNYPRMITGWRQRARREGIVVKEVSFSVPPPSMEHIVQRYAEAITPRTRVIEVTHITNLSGQIMPVREIVSLAKPRGIEVFVDGAHAYAHFPFARESLDCDYYGTSLHKWLLAPVGTGFLYVRKDKQGSLWPLMAAPETMDDNIRKYEEIGTHPAANHNAIAAALAFHQGIGAERKIARLRYLRDRWAKPLLEESDRVTLLTPLDSPHSGAIGLVDVEGFDMGELGSWLRRRHGIIIVPIVHPEFQGLRVTPNVYTTPEEVDRFAEAIREAIHMGIG